MRRLIKNGRGLREVTFKGDNFEVVIGEEKFDKAVRGGEYLVYTFVKDTYIYELEVKETENCFFYEIVRVKAEEVMVEEPIVVEEEEVVITNILDLEKVQIPVEDFYIEYERAVHIESEEEVCLGFVKEDNVYIPVGENNGFVDTIIVKESSINTTHTITSATLSGKLFYLGMSKNDVSLSNTNIVLKYNKNNIYKKDVKELWKVATNGNKTYFMVELDKIICVNEFDLNGKAIFTYEEVSSIPSGSTILKERYISKKKTRGITDTMTDPFKWLKY